ncbi:MAG TPA: discoidin domain-containing protein, partial [Gemmatimonadales bacterium]
MDGDASTAWGASGDAPWVLFDFLKPRELGGLVIDWLPERHATDYTVEFSPDGSAGTRAYRVREGNGVRDFLYLPESETRYLRLRLTRGTRAGMALGEVTVEPVDWADSPTAFIQRVAAESEPGSFPRYLSNTQVYWTVLGASGDGRRGLLNEDGAMETGQGRFSIEPFLAVGERLLSWKDASRATSLERGDLPIPSVTWTSDPGGQLTITGFAAGPAGSSSLLARYRVRNQGRAPVVATLYLAIRPLQVNPPWQFLGTPGGAAPIRSIRYQRPMVAVDSQLVVAVTSPGGFGATTLDRGDIVEHLRAGRVPPPQQMADSAGWVSAALAYPVELAPGGMRDVWIEVPLYGIGAQVPPAESELAADKYGEQRLAATVKEWSERLDRVGLRLPPGGGAASRRAPRPRSGSRRHRTGHCSSAYAPASRSPRGSGRTAWRSRGSTRSCRGGTRRSSRGDPLPGRSRRARRG